jgi:hypothetical protein
MNTRMWNALGSDETDLVGQWLLVDGRVEGDAVSDRIQWLLPRLDEIAHSADGWDTLYRDHRDGRWWELTYPQSEMHGGGPQRLTNISPAAVKAKYGIATA